LFGLWVSDVKVLKDAFTAISTIIDDPTFNMGAEGIRIRAMDPSRVAMVDFEMRKTVFEEYASSENLKVRLDINDLLKLLKRAEREEPVELVLDEETARLKILIRGGYARTFDMPTLGFAEEDELPTPKISFNAKLTLKTEDLCRMLEDVALVSDHVQIEARDDGLLMNTKGELRGVDIELKKGDILLEAEVKESSKTIYSLDYLSDIVKAAAPTSDLVTLELSTGMPVRLDFKQRHDGKLVYYLAPRIEVE